MSATDEETPSASGLLEGGKCNGMEASGRGAAAGDGEGEGRPRRSPALSGSFGFRRTSLGAEALARLALLDVVPYGGGEAKPWRGVDDAESTQ